MLTITQENNALIVKGQSNGLYPDNGTNSYPLNSISLVVDESDIATFRSAATNDVLFSGKIDEITIGGNAVTKDTIFAAFDAVANSSSGGGGDVDAYTKAESDAKFATQTALSEVDEKAEAAQTTANDADTKADAVTSRVEDVETSLDDKQDVLVSGVNIKTVNGESILGEGNIEVDLTDYYTKTESDERFATISEMNDAAADISALEADMTQKQATLVSGENIKTINGGSILGEGDIEIPVIREWTGTQEAYDAIETKDPDVTYFITESSND